MSGLGRLGVTLIRICARVRVNGVSPCPFQLEAKYGMLRKPKAQMSVLNLENSDHPAILSHEAIAGGRGVSSRRGKSHKAVMLFHNEILDRENDLLLGLF